MSISSNAVPKTRQKTLNRYLGLELQQIQTKVDSLFRRQERIGSLQIQAKSLATTSKMVELNHNKDTKQAMEITASSDIEEAPTSQAVNGRGGPDSGIVLVKPAE